MFAWSPVLCRRDTAAVVQRSVPVLRYLEKVVHPRWHTPLKTTKRLVGTVVVILSTTLVFIPIPLSNVVPALVIALISLAYLEEDGVLLSITLLATVIVMTVTTMGVAVQSLSMQRRSRRIMLLRFLKLVPFTSRRVSVLLIEL